MIRTEKDLALHRAFNVASLAEASFEVRGKTIIFHFGSERIRVNMTDMCNDGCYSILLDKANKN